MLKENELLEGKYRILRKIGQGGMSVVWLALNERANKTWAIKEVRKDGVINFEAVRQGLVGETDILKVLKHPSLPSIIDVIDTDDSLIIVMDYIEGNNLDKILSEFGAQSQENVVNWALQLCDVLGYLHTRKPPIIYRDMKPANVMLKPDGKISLIDFGTAREFKEKNLADTTCLGTVGYAAPEQFGGIGQTDARTDIYCLGATLYHVITGKNPSEPPYEMVPIRQINPKLSKGLEDIILKCTEKDPAKRYQSTSELTYALEHYQDQDEGLHKHYKKKLGVFILTAVLAVVMFIAAGAAKFLEISQSEAVYQSYMNQADLSSDYADKIKDYISALQVSGYEGKKEPYIKIMQAYKMNDSVFTVAEAKEIEKLITLNREKLEKTDNYVDICFEAGKLYWYYFDYGNGADNQITRAKSAVVWFKEVLQHASEDYENIGMAKTYAEIGEFYRDIATQITEANDTGKYKPFYESLHTLLTEVVPNESEAEIVRLELAEMVRNTIQQYATKLKVDGIEQKELNSDLDLIQKFVSSIKTTTELTENMRIQTMQSIEDTRQTVKVAYESGGGER